MPTVVFGNTHSTSIEINNITGLASCQLHTSITVTPYVPPFGAIVNSTSEPLDDIMIFITPGKLRSYTQLLIQHEYSM